jgi:phosphoenolpyruvate carboxykinase (ATP)
VLMTVAAKKAGGDLLSAINGASRVYRNNNAGELVEFAIRRAEGRFAASGALTVNTGLHTGRSAADKFIVYDETTAGEIWWDANKALKPDNFQTLYADMLEYARGKELFVQDLYAGADPAHRLGVRVLCEYAWHALFIQHLLIVPPEAERGVQAPDFAIIDLPGFRADPARYGVRSETVIACDFSQRLVLIGGTSYAGEIKKSVFTYLNYVLPAKDVMPMHCSANASQTDSAIFFGLSGTGKTTLSADPARQLIGDDEHGWSENGIFNFEGGCYAKVINLSAENEPQIFAAVSRYGTVLENVVLDEATRAPDFYNGSLTENTRGAYPLDFISNASTTGQTAHPRNIVMLTADAFGVLPPIARLTPSQAMYHFLSGYTAKVAGTEKGVKEPQATFSTCFGAPFMPRHPSVYGNLLRTLIGRHGVSCWLVNTGWTGGAYGTGSRMSLPATRALLGAALAGKFAGVEMRRDEIFGFEVPVMAEGVDPVILNPRDTWADKAAYDAQAAKLAGMFAENFGKFAPHVDDDVNAAGPVTGR